MLEMFVAVIVAVSMPITVLTAVWMAHNNRAGRLVVSICIAAVLTWGVFTALAVMDSLQQGANTPGLWGAVAAIAILAAAYVAAAIRDTLRSVVSMIKN